MISAYCSGTFNSCPLVPLANGALRQQSEFDNAARNDRVRKTLVGLVRVPSA